MKNILHIQDYKFILTNIIFFYFSFQVYSQNENNLRKYLLKDIGDTYVVSVKFHKNLYEKPNKCFCKKNEICAIYSVEIISTLFIPKYAELNEKDLKNIKYILVGAEKINSLKISSEQIVTLQPSSSKNYLILSKILEGVSLNDNTEFIRVSGTPYLTSVMKCPKLSFFSHSMIFFGLRNREKAMEKSTKYYKDPYEEFIRENLK